jgi:D-alanyl-lipoteichoic acid acyltransferase DltB (MBOAT superfamily)
MLMGFYLPKNFDSPYKSRNPQEFWRRWHMSLSRWLKNYLYIPIGGNRKILGKSVKNKNTAGNFNSFITMLLGGLWHGASWNFVIWGALNGIGMIIYKIWAKINWNLKILLITSLTVGVAMIHYLWDEPIYNILFIWMLVMWGGTLIRYIHWWVERWGHIAITGTKRSKIINYFSNGWAIIQTFVFITFTRLFFRSGSNLDPATASQEAWETAKNMINQIGGAWDNSIIPAFIWEYRWVVMLFILGMIIHWMPTRAKRWYRIRFALLPTWSIVLIAIVAIIAVYQFVTADMQPFIYFQF